MILDEWKRKGLLLVVCSLKLQTDGISSKIRIVRFLRLMPAGKEKSRIRAWAFCRNVSEKECRPAAFQRPAPTHMPADAGTTTYKSRLLRAAGATT